MIYESRDHRAFQDLGHSCDSLGFRLEITVARPQTDRWSVQNKNAANNIIAPVVPINIRTLRPSTKIVVAAESSELEVEPEPEPDVEPELEPEPEFEFELEFEDKLEPDVDGVDEEGGSAGAAELDCAED